MGDISEPNSGDPHGWLLGLLGALTVVLAVLFTMIMMWTLRSSGGQWWRRDYGQALSLDVVRGRGVYTQLATVGAGILLFAEVIGLRARLVDPQHHQRTERGAVLRSLSLVAMGGALIMLPAWNLLGAIPIGAIIGAEMVTRRSPQAQLLRSHTLSVRIRHRLTAWVAAIAPVGFLLALAISRVHSDQVVPQWQWVVGVEVALMVVCVAVTASLVRSGLNRLGGRLTDELLGFVRGLREAESRHRAQWVHDHLLSEIRLLILRLEARGHSDPDVLNHLREADHRLRMAHLAELIEAGPVRISALVQPHIRRCVDLGVEVSEVPHFGQVDFDVDSDTGRLIGRVLSGLFSNAMNAGAQRIGLEVYANTAGVEIRVSDDAGGFDLMSVPAGRGLHQLIDEIGATGVMREDIPGGSLMRVLVPHRVKVMAVVGGGGSVPYRVIGRRFG
jgi:hypothetical protein